MATEQIRIKTITVKDRSKGGVVFKNNQVMVSIKDDKERWMSQFFQAGHPVTQKRPGDTLTVDLERKGDSTSSSRRTPPTGSRLLLRDRIAITAR